MKSYTEKSNESIILIPFICGAVHCIIRRGSLLFIFLFTWPQINRKVANSHSINVKWARLVGFFLNPKPGEMHCLIYQVKGEATDRTNRKTPLELDSVLQTLFTKASLGKKQIVQYDSQGCSVYESY